MKQALNCLTYLLRVCGCVGM